MKAKQLTAVRHALAAYIAWRDLSPEIARFDTRWGDAHERYMDALMDAANTFRPCPQQPIHGTKSCYIAERDRIRTVVQRLAGTPMSYRLAVDGRTIGLYDSMTKARQHAAPYGPYRPMIYAVANADAYWQLGTITR